MGLLNYRAFDPIELKLYKVQHRFEPWTFRLSVHYSIQSAIKTFTHNYYFFPIFKIHYISIDPELLVFMIYQLLMFD